MGRDTAFWEAVVALAPILGLTLVLEVRQTRWQAYPSGAWRVGVMLFMTLSLAGLAWAAGESIEVLAKWDPKVPPSADTAQVVQFIVQLAIAGILMPPVSQTLFIFFGRGSAKMHRLNREYTKQNRWFKRHIGDLDLRERNLAHEVCELILANPRGVYRTSDTGDVQVVVSDARIQQLRTELCKVREHIVDDMLRWRKLIKKNRKRLKRADQAIGIGHRTKWIKRLWPAP